MKLSGNSENLDACSLLQHNKVTGLKVFLEAAKLIYLCCEQNSTFFCWVVKTKPIAVKSHRKI